MLAAPDMREVLAFQEDTTTVTGIGGESSAWATLDTLRGQVTALSGRELAQVGAVNSNVTYRVIVRQGQLEAATVSVSSITETGGTATVTTAAAHGLAEGEYVRIAGATPADYNARWLVASVSSTMVYTFAITGSPDDATGTVTSMRLKPIAPDQRILWTPSWDQAQAAITLEVLALRPFASGGISKATPRMGRRWTELDCGEVN